MGEVDLSGMLFGKWLTPHWIENTRLPLIRVNPSPIKGLGL
jgi:hypothetical protein